MASLDLGAVFANVVVVLILGVAVAGPRVSPLARLAIATFAFGCAWLITAVFAETPAPGWTTAMGGALLVVSIVVVIATLQLWTEADDDRLAHRGDEGGGGPRRRWPEAPPPGGGEGDLSWWPEFERQLASYVAERRRPVRSR